MARWVPWFGLVAVSALIFYGAQACGASNKSTFEDTTDAGMDAGDEGNGGDDVGLPIQTMDAGGCVNLQCQQTACPTSLSGTVYAPNGTLPLYNVIVYVPNGPLDPLPKGVQCDKCGAIASGSPLTTALSDAKGHFVLNNMPAGADIPLVVQLGKWRRVTKIPNVAACAETKLVDPNLTRLPKNQKEGNMPHIALTAGGCDALGCMLPKIGIDPKEFGYESDGYAKAVNVYNGSGGAVTPATPASHIWGQCAGGCPPGATDDKLLKTYDLAIFSCECYEAPDSKGSFGDLPFTVVNNYLNAGGRIFTTDFQYTWYKFNPDPNMGIPSAGSSMAGIGQIIGGAPSGNNPLIVDTSFPKGKALADWLEFVFPTNLYTQVQEDYVFSNIQSLVASKTQDWANSGGPMGPRIFTVNTPVGKPSDQQCGKGVHIDTHVTQPGTGGDDVNCMGTTCYPATCTAPFKEDEAAFAFFFFDLSACIQNDNAMPVPPPPAR
jgi:hypothetical protein